EGGRRVAHEGMLLAGARTMREHQRPARRVGGIPPGCQGPMGGLESVLTGHRRPAKYSAHNDFRGLQSFIHKYTFMDMRASAGLFRLLGDEVRLRILRLLAAEALNVTELTGIVGIAQSGVSRHLGLLRDAGLVTEERR